MDVHVHLARYFRICKHMDVQSSSLSATAKRYAEQVAAGEILACHGSKRSDPCWAATGFEPYLTLRGN